LTWPSSPVSLLRILLALFWCPARLGRNQRPPRPTGPSLREGYAVLPLLATMTRCADLDDSPGLPRNRLVIPEALPDDLVWAAIETVPTLSHSPFSACRCLYAGGNDGCTGPDPSPSSSPSPSKGGLGSLVPCPWLLDRPAFRRMISLRSRSGPQSCSPLDQARPLRGSRDFYTRAFPTAGHPTAKSSITTQLSGLLLRRNFHPLGECCCGLQLRSAGVTPLHRYYGPFRHPLVSGRFPRGPLVIRPPCSAAFAAGQGGLLQLLAVPLPPCRRSHPAGGNPPPRPACGGPLLPSRAQYALGLRMVSICRGYLCVHSRYGPVTRSHPPDGFVDGLQSVGLPSPCHPSYGAAGSCPGGTGSR